MSEFFIVSGAALMYNYGDLPHLNLKAFYWKRFVSIFPMFYLAYAFAEIYLILSTGVVSTNVPKKMMLLTLIGVDGYVSMTGVQTFYLLGEWFLGFIIIFYIIFPILRYGVKHHPCICACIFTLAYIFTIVYNHPILGMPQSKLLTTRLPELLFGMYFVQYCREVPHYIVPLILVFLGMQQMFKPIQDDLAVTCVGVSCFLFLVVVSRWFDKRPIRGIVGSLSKYSYAIFLVHHRVITRVFEVVKPSMLGKFDIFILFLTDVAIILVLCFFLKWVTDKVMLYLRSIFEVE